MLPFISCRRLRTPSFIRLILFNFQSIIEELKKDPITIPEFVAKFQHVNQIEWAQVWVFFLIFYSIGNKA